MSNGKKQLSLIKQEHNGPTPNYNEKFADLGVGVKRMSAIKRDLPKKPYLAGQDIGRGPQGRVFTGVDIKNGPKKGDIIHGANKYANKALQVEDLDFTYRPSSRGGWKITGVGR